VGIYERYATIYDANQMGFSERMIPYLQQVLDRQGVTGDKAVDVACGTGTVALWLAGRGWRTYGVDASPAMLAQARLKAEGAGCELRLLQADMRAFSLPERVDLATCFFDSLNYLLTPMDLQQAFTCVARALRPGGAFIFDMNTPYALAEVWDHNCFFTEDEQISLIMQSDYLDEAHTVTVQVVAFVCHGETYERIAETHVERGYAEPTVAAALERAGLVPVTRYDCFGFDPPRSRTERILWVAARPQEC
jgi:ubiquinone/menaquinone biosynthesis C-methylase UbiE